MLKRLRLLDSIKQDYEHERWMSAMTCQVQHVAKDGRRLENPHLLKTRELRAAFNKQKFFWMKKL